MARLVYQDRHNDKTQRQNTVIFITFLAALFFTSTLSVIVEHYAMLCVRGMNAVNVLHHSAVDNDLRGWGVTMRCSLVGLT